MSYLENIRTFVRVYELGSMSAAGRDLRISPAVTSARISQLEDHLSVRLFQRTTRSLTPTEQGQAFYGGACEVLESVENAEAQVVNITDNPKGSLFVAAPLGVGRDGSVYNVNGDNAAGAIAAAMKADRLLLLTDVSGVKDAEGDVVTQLTAEQVRQMTADGVIAGGMIPKTETALAAIEGGVRAVVILDGRAPHACLLELFTEHGAGSMIRL